VIGIHWTGKISTVLHPIQKKYLFIPYALLIIHRYGCVVAISNEKEFILSHACFLCLYTAIIIIQQYGLKLFGQKPKLRSYGDKDIV